jgi:murein DD-endopeptidase MepM/ murein hydrolase activator NlpD
MDREGAFCSAAICVLAAGALLTFSVFADAADLPQNVTVHQAQAGKLELRLDRLVAGGELVSGFGWRRHPMGGGGAHHDGIDIKAPRGAPVRAAAPGTVAEIAWGSNFGRYVRLRHGDQAETVYAHLSRVPKSLKVGQRVGDDDVIGFVGSTGRSTGPHLHFEVRQNGRPIDPLTGTPRRTVKKAGKTRR